MNTRVAIVTVSDKASAGTRNDLSGPALKKSVEEKGMRVTFYKVIPDEIEKIAEVLKSITDSNAADIILTTGGTGFSKRDVTPEATRQVIEKETPGISEMIRAESAKITNRAWLSRAISGIRKETLIINLPGSPKAAVESFDIVHPILGHGLEVLRGEVSECGKISK